MAHRAISLNKFIMSHRLGTAAEKQSAYKIIMGAENFSQIMRLSERCRTRVLPRA